MCCTQLLLKLGSEAQRDRWLPALACGELVLALAHSEGAMSTCRQLRAAAVRDAGGWRLNGHKRFVPHGGEARSWIFSARCGDEGTGLFLVEEAAPGVRVERYPCIDASVGCDLQLADTHVAPAAVLGEPGPDIASAVEAALDWALIGQCAESVGAQAALLDATIDYVKTRRQFGAPIGSFQAVQHRLAEMLIALEQARSLAWYAAVNGAAADTPERQRITSSAKVRCIESGRFIGLQAIHLHGGIGMTDELPVGRFVKRLVAIEHTFGDQRHHLKRLASRAPSDFIAI